MDAKYLKEYIYLNNHAERILGELGMLHIKRHAGGKYFTCCMPDGDNASSTVIYNSEYLNVTAYTRDIRDNYGNSDILSLVCFVRKCYFSHAIKFICDAIGLDYYFSPEDGLPESVKWTRMLLKMQSRDAEEESGAVKPIDEKILSYFVQRPVLQWINEGIGHEAQREFEIGFDLCSERITVPIRDDIGNLVGVKGRLLTLEPTELTPKYMYLEKCPKSQILYGLYKTMPYIKQSGYVIVCESEKGVMQLWSQGYKNAVSVGGHTLSKTQTEKLTRLNAGIVIAFDRDIPESDVLKECGKFLSCVSLSYIIDKDNLLAEKESPTDSKDKFKRLIENNKYTYVRG